MLSVRELAARLGRFKLEALSFTAAPGEPLAILGPNGSGKTTLLRLIAGLQAPRAGEIAWGETVLSEPGRVRVPPAERGVSLLFQEAVLFPHLDVRENVALGLPPGFPREEGRARVDRALASMRIPELERRAVPDLSGGEQQRVALARALVDLPRLLLLDEPFHSLDGPVRRAIIEELRGLCRERGIAALLVTHDLDEAALFADRILLLRDGRRLQEGTMESLYREPVDLWAARFLGEVESLERERARDLGIELPEGCEGPRVWFRPGDLVLTPSDAAEGLTVARARGLGELAELTLTLPDGSELRSRSSTAIPVGARVRARIVRALPAGIGENQSGAARSRGRGPA
jgi:ABC-type Fe3+/spermidine/putrescine transport system ATPase subunit